MSPEEDLNTYLPYKSMVPENALPVLELQNACLDFQTFFFVNEVMPVKWSHVSRGKTKPVFFSSKLPCLEFLLILAELVNMPTKYMPLKILIADT